MPSSVEALVAERVETAARSFFGPAFSDVERAQVEAIAGPLGVPALVEALARAYAVLCDEDDAVAAATEASHILAAVLGGEVSSNSRSGVSSDSGLEGEPDVTTCPVCGSKGRYEGRVLINGRGYYECASESCNARWQDVREKPSTKAMARVSNTPTPTEGSER